MQSNDPDNLITSAMRQAQVPGLGVALVEGDRIVYDRVFGVQDAASRTELRHDTLFQAASLSKPVFAYLVLMLVADGRLQLDVPLTDYWRDESIDDPRLSQITARHVLSHSTGFPNWAIGSAAPCSSWSARRVVPRA